MEAVFYKIKTVLFMKPEAPSGFTVTIELKDKKL